MSTSVTTSTTFTTTKSLSYLTSLHSKYKSALNLTKEELVALLEIQKKHVDTLNKKHRLLQDRLTRLSKLIPNLTLKRSKLQSQEIQVISKRIESERHALKQEKINLNKIKKEISQWEKEQREQNLQIDVWFTKNASLEAALEEFNLWSNDRYIPTVRMLEDQIHQNKTLIPTMQSQILQLKKEIEINEKSANETKQQANQLVKFEDQTFCSLYKHEQIAFKHKLNFERLKVTLSQIHLLLRINQSTKNDYRRKLAEMEMNRDGIQLEVERFEKEIKTLEEKLLEEHIKLYELKYKVEEFQDISYQNSKSVFLLTQELHQKQNILINRQSRSKRIVNSLTELRKQKLVSQQEHTKLTQNTKSLEDERIKRQEMIQEFQREISENLEKLKHEKIKKTSLKRQVEQLVYEMRNIEIKIFETRKRMEGLKQKSKKDKQDLIEAQRDLQVHTRKYTNAKEKSQNQEEELLEQEKELQSIKDQLLKLPKDDRKQTIQLRGKIGTYEFNIQELKLSLLKLKEEERKRSNDFIIATREMEYKDQIYKQSDAKSLESIAENALLVKDKGELKKKLDEIKLQLQEQQKVVEDLKIRYSGEITQSKLVQLNLSLKQISIQKISSEIKTQIMDIKLKLIDRYIEYWEKELTKSNQFVEEIQQSIEELQTKEKEAIKTLAQSQLNLDNLKKNEYHNQFQTTQSIHKQIKLCRGNLESVVITRERFTALCKYLPWADEGSEIPYDIPASEDKQESNTNSKESNQIKPSLEQLRNEYGKIENDIEDEKHNIQKLKEDIKQDEQEIESLSRKRSTIRIVSTTDETQKSQLELSHKLLIMEETLKYDTKQLKFENQTLKDIDKQRITFQKEMSQTEKNIQNLQTTLDHTSSQMVNLQTKRQHSVNQMDHLRIEISSLIKRLDSMNEKEYEISLKISETNSDISLTQEEKDAFSKLLDEIAAKEE